MVRREMTSQVQIFQPKLDMACGGVVTRKGNCKAYQTCTHFCEMHDADGEKIIDTFSALVCINVWWHNICL